MIPLGLLASGIGIGAGIKLIKGAHENNLANKVVVPDATYTTSPYAANTLDLAKQMFNSAMPGEQHAKESIDTNQANTNAAVERNSTSGAESLAMLAATQGISDNAYEDLQGKEAGYKAAQFNNLASANYGMTTELDKVYQDKVRKQQQALDEKIALRGASNANFGNAMTDLTTGAFMFDQFGTGKSKATPLRGYPGQYSPQQPI